MGANYFFLFTCIFLLTNNPLSAKGMQTGDEREISRAFELRFVTDNPEADGETDFKGETEIFDLEERIGYLRNWADYGRHFFNDPELDRIVVTGEEVEAVLGSLKPQPLPEVRTTIRLDNWVYLGYREGQREEELEQARLWNEQEGVVIDNGKMTLSGNSFRAGFDDQSWRFRLSWEAMVPETPGRVTFNLSDHITLGFNDDGRFFYVVDGTEIPAGYYTPGEVYLFEVEVDANGGLTPDYERTDVEASSQIAIDPETHRYHKRHHPAVYAAHGWNFWSAEDTGYPQWISFRLKEEKLLTGAELTFRVDEGRRYYFRVETSDDNRRWRSVTGDELSSAGQFTNVVFSKPEKARYVRILFTGSEPAGRPAALAMAGFYDENGRVQLADDKPFEGRYNFSVDGKRYADYVPFSHQGDGEIAVFNSLKVDAGGEAEIYSIWGVGYDQVTGRDVRTHPFNINTFIDPGFSARPDPAGFENQGYDDTSWQPVPYNRYAHGGERRKGESLYLRHKVDIGQAERAVMNIETVRPSADVYINGVHLATVGRYPEKLDITNKLVPEQENLVALRVDPYSVDEVRHHMSSDPHTGWFAGLIDIELTGRVFIDDVFAYTESVGDPAVLRLQVMASSASDRPFEGEMITRVYPWYPHESSVVAAESSVAVRLAAGHARNLETAVSVPSPELWTFSNPNLYKVQVILKDKNGKPVDDFVLTTGLRTVSQDGGTFRINGSPEMLNGPLLFGFHYPLEHIAQWMFSPPKQRWIHDILLTKKMNGNTLRMSVHDRRVAGVNDRRLAQIGDQVGIMFMWQTPVWVREGTADDFDFYGVPLYVREVRNHPSIVMWQPGNHPSPHYSMDWFQAVHDAFAEVDHTRLISPSADMSRMQGDFKKRIGDTWRPADDDTTYPAWTSPLLARGTMEQVLAYGQDWSDLRNFPGMHGYRGMELEVRTEYLTSKTHAWFDFESEETIAQPNWNLTRGKPYHKMYSYEINYDVGSIGRKLRFDEWRESQAWQAISAYEAYRKKRWLGFDGMNWCPLRGGGNTATYMKPLLDYHNHPKLSYYAMQMVFQPVLAGSRNVDIAYGPNDEIPVMIMNLGRTRIVDVLVRVKNMDGETMAQKIYRDIELSDGKGVVELGTWMPGLEPERYYAFEYIVLCAE